MPALQGTRGTRLSVIVPCRDVAAFLPTALRSAARNAADDIEWILVDDGSADGTAQQLAAFAPPAGRAVVLGNPGPLGVAAARNRGVAAASGRYIAFLDPDDWLAPGYLPRLTDAIEQLGVDFVRTDHVQVEGRTRTVRRAPEARRWRALPARSGIGTTARHATMVDYPNVWSGVYAVRLRDRGLLTVDDRVQTAEDRLMLWRLHLHADSFAVVGRLGYFYRRAVAGSLTAVGDGRQLHFFDAYDLIARELDGDPDLSQYRAKFARAYVTLILHHERSRARLRPAVHEEFRRRARSTLRAMPGPVLEAAASGLDAERLRLLEVLA